MVEVRSVRVCVLDGLVSVPVNVPSDKNIGLVVVVVVVVVAVLVFVLDDRVAMDVLVRSPQ